MATKSRTPSPSKLFNGNGLPAASPSGANGKGYDIFFPGMANSFAGSLFPGPFSNYVVPNGKGRLPQQNGDKEPVQMADKISEILGKIFGDVFQIFCIVFYLIYFC